MAKNKDAPYERKVLSVAEKSNLAEEEKQRNRPMNDMLRGFKGDQVDHAGMNQFIREQVRRSEADDPELAVALANESDDKLNELLAKMRKAKLNDPSNIPAQRKVTQIMRAIVRELKKRKKL
jgi:hypothetical protein